MAEAERTQDYLAGALVTKVCLAQSAVASRHPDPYIGALINTYTMLGVP